MKQATLKKLKKAVDKLIEEGYGDYNLILSDDNEGNGYHGMFYLLTPVEEKDIDETLEMTNDNNASNKLIIVG